MLAPGKTACAGHWPSPGGHEESSRYAGRDEDLPDTYLVQRTREGYLDAYGELVDRHGPRAYRVALGLLGNKQDAEDVTQEAFVAAWRQLPSFRGDASYPTWLFQIVTRRALNRVTRAPAAASLDRLGDVSCPTAEPALEVERAATADAVTAAVAALPPPQRLAIVLHHFEGLPNSEVARITASTVPAVRSHLLRGRRTLARTLQDWK
jgi:RNA polymerase sigma-70 factor (ECF subfamily)